MKTSIEYETPENVMLSYNIAGPGSRFLAWFLDNLLITVMLIALFFASIFMFVIFETTFSETVDEFFDSDLSEEDFMQFFGVFMGVFILIRGLGSFVYFSLFEIFMRGQTPGKRMSQIRVVKKDGFSLDGTSIFLRNIFRVIDQIPVFWIVPVLNKNMQRFGDMIGGTIVISEETPAIHPLRSEILEIPAQEIQFRFSTTTLNRLTLEQLSGIEKLCERWESIDDVTRHKLMKQIIPPLATCLKVEQPAFEQRYQFLTDLLYAEYQRQERMLG